MSTKEIPRWLKIEGETVLLSSGHAAKFFGVTVKTLNLWAKEGCPKVSRGWWDPRAIMEWRGETVTDEDKEAQSVHARKLKADADYREARAAEAIRKNEILEGLYIEKDDLETQWARRVTEVKTGLLALSNKIVGQITDPDLRLEVERVINDEVYELLEQYARDGSYTPKTTRKRKS